MTEIGNEAFQNCTALTSIEIPEAVTELGAAAFKNCTALTEVRYNAIECADVRGLSANGGTFYNAGQNGKGITVIIGAKVKRIRNYLFDSHADNTDYFAKVVNVIFEDGSVCRTIGSSTFYDCRNLTNVYYHGTAEDWANMSIGLSNDFLTNATRYYYSETQPTETGNYWHYVDGEVTVW